MNTPVREGETIEGSRTMRNRPYQVLKCSTTSCRGAWWNKVLLRMKRDAMLTKKGMAEAEAAAAALTALGVAP